MPVRKKKENQPEAQVEQSVQPPEKPAEVPFSQVMESVSLAGLEEGQKKMIAGVLGLGRTTVKEIMVPRPEIVCAEENSLPQQIRQLVLEKGHSRIPLYQGDIDRVSGILHFRDLLVAEAHNPQVAIKQIARKPYFVPDGKKVDDLLVEMRKEKTQIALVVDEYGGIAGLVTMEDIIEEIVGEIEGEYVKEEPDIQKVDENTILVKAKIGLKDINEALGTKLPEEKFESVGGFIYDIVGGVPEQGKVIKHKNLKFQVEKVIGQRIKWVRVSKKG